MDLSQYAELFLAESREHLSACNHLLLQWERTPTSPEPVGGIFRAVHTVKGMAATMGYARVADLAHRMENLLDKLRRGAKPPTGELLQLLFRATDLLEKTIDLASTGREGEADVTGLGAELDAAAKRAGGAPAGRGSKGAPAASAKVAARPAPAPFEVTGTEGGRLVSVVLRAEAQLKGGRALLVLRRAQALGTVTHVSPPVAAFESEEFDGRFSLRLDSHVATEEVERQLSGAGDVERVTVSGFEVSGGKGDATTAERSRHIRVDLRRLDALMNLIGELVIARGRLNDLAAARRDPAVDDVAIQVSRLTSDLQTEIIQARMTPVWQVFDRFPRLVRDLAQQLEKAVALRVEGKEIELDRRSWTRSATRWCTCCATPWTTASNRRRSGSGAASRPEGEIVLAAVRERASVAISIADDGRGIDRARILDEAKHDGLVDPHRIR